MKYIRILSIICCLFLFSLASFGQTEYDKNIRLEKGITLFNMSLQKVFIHPDQLNDQNKKLCREYIQSLQEKFEEDFIEVQFEQAFRSSPVTHFFRPIFIYPNGQKYTLPGFQIMQ